MTRKQQRLSSIYLATFAITFLVLQICFQNTAPAIAQEPIDPTRIPGSAGVEDWERFLEPTQNCPLPCFWGLVPNQSTLPEVVTILFQSTERLRVGYNVFNVDQTSILGVTVPHEASGTEELLQIQFHFRENILETIFLRADARFNPTTEVLGYFGIESLLRNYGTPDSIRLMVDPTCEILDRDQVQMYWRELGLYVSYVQGKENCNTTSRSDICFQHDILRTVVVGIYDPFAEPTLEDILVQQGSDDPTVMELLGLTNQEFIDLIAEENYCLPSDLQISLPD